MSSKKIKTLFGLAVSICGLMCGAVHAGVTYSYVAINPGDTTPSTSITIPVGAAAQTIGIYLQEQLTAPSTSLIAGDGGLYSGGFSMALNGSPANPATLTAAAGNAALFAGGNSVEAGSGDSNALRRIDNTVSNSISAAGTGGPTPSNSLILIGTVTITPASVASSTPFTIWDYERTNVAGQLVGGYTQTNGNTDYNLDLTTGQYSGAGANPVTYTVITSTPEPVSASLFGLAAVGLLVRRRRVA